MFQANIVPGQGFTPFTICEKTASVNNTGRANASEHKYTRTDKTLYGIVVNASQKEQEQWKQNGHPITHKVIQYACMVKAKATDILEGESAQYIVQGRRNPGELNVTEVYYVEERLDFKEVISDE